MTAPLQSASVTTRMLPSTCPMSAPLLERPHGPPRFKEREMLHHLRGRAGEREGVSVWQEGSWPILNHFRSGTENSKKISQS
jgi:hypothetical protein